MNDIKKVQNFWESNPLFAGETTFVIGTKDFFEEHKRVIIEDAFVGELDERFFPQSANRDHVLDLGCGPGFWTTEFLLRGVADKVTAGDLTTAAQELTKKRLAAYNLSAEVCSANAEDLPFENSTFSHVNCTGVIHHTPNTEKCVAEIARVLRPGGTAMISVYYKNIILRSWFMLRPFAFILGKLGAALKGRGRESIFLEKDINEIVRIYDGFENPIGKAYSKRDFIEMLSPYFKIEEVHYNFFPARALPFRIPKSVHKILNRLLPFMINANLRKR